MASRPTQVSVGGIVNPLEGLQQGLTGATDLYGKYLDRKKQDALLALKEEELGWKRDDRAKAEKEREALLSFGKGHTDAAAIAPNLGDTSDRLAKDYEVRARNALAERMMISPQGDQLKEQTGEFGSVVTQANMPDYEAKSATQRLAELEPDYNKRFNMLYGKDAKDVLGLFSDTSVVSREDETARLMQKALAEGVPIEKAMPTITALASKYKSDKEIQASLDKRADAMYEREKDANSARLSTLRANNTGRNKSGGDSSKASFGGYKDPIGQEKFDSPLFYVFTADDINDAREARNEVQKIHAAGGEYNGTSLENVDVKTLNNIVEFALQQANNGGDFEKRIYDETIEAALRNPKQFSGSSNRSTVDLDKFVTKQVTMPSAEDYRTRNWTSARDRLLGRTLERRPSADIGIDRPVVENTGTASPPTGSGQEGNTPPVGSGSAENPAVEAAQEEVRKASPFMQRMVNTPSPFPEDNQEKPEEELNGVAKVAKRDYDNFVALKKANPKLDPLNVREAELNNRYLRSRNLTEEELKGTVDFPVTQYRGLSDEPLENVSPILSVIGAAKVGKELYRGGKSLLDMSKAKNSLDSKLLTSKNPNVIAEEKRVADRMNQIAKRKTERKLIEGNPKAGKSGDSIISRPVLNSNPSSSTGVSNSAKKVGEQLRNKERSDRGLRTINQSKASRSSRNNVSVEEKVKQAQKRFDTNNANKPTKSKEEIINNLKNWNKERGGINPLLQDNNNINFLK